VPRAARRRSLLKKREHIRKIVEIRADLEKDERLTLDMLEEKLGDFGLTPLGKAALAKAASIEKATPPAPRAEADGGSLADRLHS
jgi:hypothetical protein